MVKLCVNREMAAVQYWYLYCRFWAEGGGGQYGQRQGGGGRPGGGGGYSVCKRAPTAVRPLESGGCRDLKRLKKKTVLILYCRIGELSESVQLLFHFK